MSKHFIISDPHFGHVNMATKRGFSDVYSHDLHIIDKWNSVVTKRDFVWVLGDFTMEKTSPYYNLDALIGTKFGVLGNHDQPQHIPELLKYVKKVCGIKTMGKHKAVLTHCPIHPTELDCRYKFNIHGHVHENTLLDRRYINVSCEAVDYTPQLISNLIEERNNELRNQEEE
tara:strand:- start:5814 stop:6329 length:516 start_codon:yes stop_codon:yes gene_type:complete